VIERVLDAGQCAGARVRGTSLKVLDRDLRNARCLREIGLRPANKGACCAYLGARDHPSRMCAHGENCKQLRNFWYAFQEISSNEHKLFTVAMIYTSGISWRHRGTPLPSLLLSLEHRLFRNDAARLSLGMSAIVVGALSILCRAVVVAIALALWELL
jgi:hypothetical protein